MIRYCDCSSFLSSSLNYNRLVQTVTNGQLISKGLFDILKFFQKTNKFFNRRLEKNITTLLDLQSFQSSDFVFKLRSKPNTSKSRMHQNHCLKELCQKMSKKILYIHIENRRVFKDSKPVQCYLPYYFWSNQRIRYSLQRAVHRGTLDFIFS